MTNKQKFLDLVSKENTFTLDNIKFRIRNREMLRESKDIALKILEKLDELQWTQKDLADKMQVTPQQVNKIVRGSENLTLDTQIRIQKILDIPILASFYEKEEQRNEDVIFSDQESLFVFEVKTNVGVYTSSTEKLSVTQINYNKATDKYSYQKAS